MIVWISTSYVKLPQVNYSSYLTIITLAIKFTIYCMCFVAKCPSKNFFLHLFAAHTQLYVFRIQSMLTPHWQKIHEFAIAWISIMSRRVTKQAVVWYRVDKAAVVAWKSRMCRSFGVALGNHL